MEKPAAQPTVQELKKWFKADENISSARIAAAARRLIEGDMADAAAGRFSNTLFIANGLNDDKVER